MLRSTPAEGREAVAGFSLIEALVALALVEILLAAIGSQMAATVRGMRSIDLHLALLETARAIETDLQDRGSLDGGGLAGERNGHRWRVDVSPFIANFVDPQLPSPWVPYTVVLRVQSPAGPILQIDTVRLRRRSGG